MAKELTEKQRRFCEEYLVDLNATQAYCRSGYSVKKRVTAEQNASKLLRNPKVQEYISALRQQQSERTGITADSVLNEIAKIAFTKDVEIVGREKMHALELLGKHLGAFDQNAVRVEVKDDPLSEALKKIANSLNNVSE